MPSRSVERVLPHDRDLLKGILRDVRGYPHFLKWVSAARSRPGSNGEIIADLIIAHRLFSVPVRAAIVEPDDSRMEIRYLDGPIRSLASSWRFQPVTGAGGRAGCRVDVRIDIDAGIFLAPVVDAVFDRGVDKLITAFMLRADELDPAVQDG